MPRTGTGDAPMGDGTSKTGPVMVQALTEATFDPAGHDHSKTILMQAALTETPTKGAAADASERACAAAGACAPAR
ncbi:unnamed protein product [Prorocentrum cordatum]|uniref:Uncharacterized protein n=1 Tax=Prorocentrum cordatum TaxID=2364126 RepID=A0ABN9S6A9_9DINO|nr:unnamed protein product [Polarella glacialis]